MVEPSSTKHVFQVVSQYSKMAGFPVLLTTHLFQAVTRCVTLSPLSKGERSGDEPMARALNKLTDKGASATKNPGRYSDGGGLYLNVASSGTKSGVRTAVQN